MVSRFLITTALEDSWSDDEPVIFLGEWCRLYSRKARWSAMDAKVLPYHWDDRDRLYKDYQYVRELGERLLVDLARQLNEIHRCDHGLRYWRILVGPWLGYFTQVLFDRWASIHRVVSTQELSGTIVLEGSEESLIPGDMADFSRLDISDEWNHLIFGSILRLSTSVPLTTLARLSPIASPPRKSWRQRARSSAARTVGRMSGLLGKSTDAFFLNTYLPAAEEAELYRRFHQSPRRWRMIPRESTAVNPHLRQWKLGGEACAGFEAFVRGFIPRQIPTAYLEGYGKLVEQGRNSPWPERPIVIFTGPSYYSDEVFKAWAAEKIEDGVPLCIGQYGGHFGTGKWSFMEDQEIGISDAYLSWGWSEPTQPSVRPVGQIKAKRPLGVEHSRQSTALLVTTQVPRYSYVMYSSMVSGQWLDYFEDQCTFAKCLPEQVQQALLVRSYPEDYDWSERDRWKDALPNLHVDDGRSNMEGLIRRCRIYVSSYNATTYLESFAMDVPTVIFWNPAHWELRESAAPYFEALKAAGIFHESPESAARHVGAIWDDVDAWWRSAKVRSALDLFKARFCDTSEGLVDRIEVVMRDVMKRTGSGSAQASGQARA